TGNGLSGLPGVLLRGLVAALCLLPPTVLMGATLPAIARWVPVTPRGISWLGWVYAGNIAGAGFGCLLAAVYLLRGYDLACATYVAASVNRAVGAVGLGLAALVPHAAPAPAVPPEQPPAAVTPPAAAPQPGTVGAENEAIYFAIALSGAAALGA